MTVSVSGVKENAELVPEIWAIRRAADTWEMAEEPQDVWNLGLEETWGMFGGQLGIVSKSHEQRADG